MDQSTPLSQSPVVPEEPVDAPAPVAPAESASGVVAAPAQSAEELAEAHEAAAGQQQAPAPIQAAVAEPNSPTASGTKLAITATIIIVIALGVLATFVFLKQK